MSTAVKTAARPLAVLRQNPYQQPRPFFSSAQYRKSPEERHSTESTASATGRLLIRILPWVPVFAFFTGNFYTVGYVTGGSMSPTLNPDRDKADLLLHNRLAVWDQDLKIGDVIELISPNDPNLLLAKRILALPGDIMTLPSHRYRKLPSSQRVSRHAADNSSQRIRDEAYHQEDDTKLFIQIPPHHVWVEGDASAHEYDGAGRDGKAAVPSNIKSRDSRDFGPIPIGLITSRLDFIVWPPSRFGCLPGRPNFDLEGALDRRKALEELQQDAAGLRTTERHPDDSPLTRYNRTADDRRQNRLRFASIDEQEQGTRIDDEHTPLSRAKMRKNQRNDAAEAHYRQRLNAMSRGGQLGLDTDSD